MLWEIWGRHKRDFFWQGAGLLASVFFVHLKEHVASQNAVGILSLASVSCFIVAYCHLLLCLGCFEIDAGTVQFSFPIRLLLKPVSTARLVLVPMLLGGAISISILMAWAELVCRHLQIFSASDLLWVSIVQLSFFWWLQALAWSLPLPKVRMLVITTMGLVHFLVWRMGQMRTGGEWHWSILAGLLVSAMLVAWIGLKLMRQGAWESPSRISVIWSRLRFARAWERRKKFGSAFRAQFWLEWRRQGLLLPGVSGGVAILIIAVFWITTFMLRRISGGAGQDGDPATALLSMFLLPVLSLPLALSVLLAPMLAKFDRLHSTSDLPIYIAVRPMTNGGFVMAKLVMALATSALTWLVTAAACVCLALIEQGTVFSKAGLVTPFGPAAYLTVCAPVLLLLVIWTWKNLVAGIGAALTGNTSIWAVSVYCRLAFFMGLFPLIGTAKTDIDFRETLLRWLPEILIACLAAKIALSIGAFVWGIRRNAITGGAVGWILGVWSLCGLFMAGCAGRVCGALHRPDLWIWGALGGFLVLPLADLAIAPLALAWNRHR
jgi:hypothetical protein